LVNKSTLNSVVNFELTLRYILWRTDEKNVNCATELNGLVSLVRWTCVRGVSIWLSRMWYSITHYSIWVTRMLWCSITHQSQWETGIRCNIPSHIKGYFDVPSFNILYEQQNIVILFHFSSLWSYTSPPSLLVACSHEIQRMMKKCDILCSESNIKLLTLPCFIIYYYFWEVC